MSTKAGKTNPERSFRVGHFLVEPELLCISSPDGRAQVEPKAMDVLVELAQSQGHVVPKDALFEAVWPDVTVGDDALFRCISQLRRAFGDSASDPKVVSTVPKRGYRLLAPVTPLPETARRRAGIWLGMAIGVFALLGALIVALRGGSRVLERSEAQDQYLEGRHLLARMGPDNVSLAIERLTAAEGLEPQNTDVLATLSRAYHARGYYEPRSRAMSVSSARRYALRALEIDPDHHQANAQLAALAHAEWRWSEAELRFRHALKAEPSNVETRVRYSEFLLDTGRLSEALLQAEQAVHDGPLSALAAKQLAWATWWALTDEDRALEAAQKARQLGETRAGFIEAQVFVSRGDFDAARKPYSEALAVIDQSDSINDRVLAAVADASKLPDALSALADAHAEGRYTTRVYCIELSILGQTDLAYALIPELVSRRELALEYLWQDVTAHIRRDARFPRLIRELELDQYWRDFGEPDRCKFGPDGLVCQ